jgi:Glycosyltransferase family 25 (LPS biosynthesis protein)
VYRMKTLKQLLSSHNGRAHDLRQQALASRENKVAGGKQTLTEREVRIGAPDQERTGEMGALREALANREAQASSLDAAISALHTSTFWRVRAPLSAARRLSERLYYSRFGYPLVLAWRAFTTCSRAPLRDWRAGRAIARSGLFDKDWYLQNNPDVAASGIEPVWHYVAHGAREGRDPSPSFSTAGYLADNADVSIAGINPLAHFVLYGAAEGRAAGALPSTAWNTNKDIPGPLNRITVLTTKHTLFIGHLIDYCLAREGYSVSVIDRYESEFDDHGIYIVVCPQMFAKRPRKFVAFQMEQSTSSRWFDDSYKMILTNAVAVLDYSLLNIAYLNKCEIPHSKLFHVPISPIAGYRSYLVSRGYKLDLSPRRKTSVLFYGDAKCARRREFLERLRARLEVKVVSQVYGQDLFNEIIGAQVVVNVHYYDSSLLETTRICEVLSLGIPIVSEESVDIEQYGGLRAVVDFTRVGDAEAMIAAVQRLLTDENVYERRIEQIYSFVSGALSFSDYLKRFLVAQGAFPFRRFLDTSTLLPRALPATPRICLSIPENAARRSAFTQRHQDFLLFDGIRYHPAWVGCGMSYKYIFSKILDTRCSQVIICEDDVLFEDHFPERLGVTIRFLESTNYQWDIFSGLIVDLHADTEILRIVEFEDNEYIFINKMTSTVFNIYNRSSFVKMAAWDETNYHVNYNTIDRYLESSSNVVVTTLPFLVGHDERLWSSIWNFQNSRYRTMLDKTCKLLERKVTEFKGQRRGPA